MSKVNISCSNFAVRISPVCSRCLSSHECATPSISLRSESHQVISALDRSIFPLRRKRRRTCNGKNETGRPLAKRNPFCCKEDPASDEMPPWYKHAKKKSRKKWGIYYCTPMLAPQSGFLPSSVSPVKCTKAKHNKSVYFIQDFLAFLVATPNRIHMMNIHTYYRCKLS